MNSILRVMGLIQDILGEPCSVYFDSTGRVEFNGDTYDSLDDLKDYLLRTCALALREVATVDDPAIAERVAVIFRDAFI